MKTAWSAWGPPGIRSHDHSEVRLLSLIVWKRCVLVVGEERWSPHSEASDWVKQGLIVRQLR